MLKNTLIMGVAFLTIMSAYAAKEDERAMNLLMNPEFEFHAFENHRLGQAKDYASHNAAFWNTDGWGDIQVMRTSHVDASIRPGFAVHNMVSIAPRKKFRQFFTLAEAGLAHGEHVSLWAYGYQKTANALMAHICLMKVDSADGQWSPKEFGMADQRTFNRHGRGELVVAGDYRATSAQTGAIELTVENAEIKGRFHADDKSYSEDINTIGVMVEFENTDATNDVWLAAPCLRQGSRALGRLPVQREMVPYYRHIPRTLQKLWKGEPIHILTMGSSIDRGSANPPLYLYDEDPLSPAFKTPLADGAFLPEKVNRPDLAGYIGWWRHYWCYTGRLRLELMRKFNQPVSKILLNVMACDGSCVGEAHSGLADYCALNLPPEENVNGHVKGKSWQELYPELFSRREGPRPDLVIFGSGANEKYDTPDEVAIFEGAIRWIQRHYPDTEFIFCMFQNRGAYTSNTGDLQALALRYQIPYLDFGKAYDDATRWCNAFAPMASDGHPQAVVHYLWFKELEKAFECWDPIYPGQAQLQLPERVHPNAYGWEGEMITYSAPHPRIHEGARMIIDDTAFNLWAAPATTNKIEAFIIDGVTNAKSRGASFAKRDVRNSTLAWGRLSLGDRHIVEVKGHGASLTAIDCKQCPDRRFIGVDSSWWRRGKLSAGAYASQWGAFYGAQQVTVPPGMGIEINVVGTDFSVAYVDARSGGILRVLVDGVEKLKQSANQPYMDCGAKKHFMENRKGILGLPYGLHTVRIEAQEQAVSVLGVFSYDSRPNRRQERSLAGMAAPGETVFLSAPFKARPFVMCSPPLAVRVEDIRCDQVTFSGTGPGAYEMIGE